MNNIFIEKITYLTEQEYKDSGGTIELDDNIKKYIRKAEIVIDSIIGKFGKKLDSKQKTIFPIIGIKGIPEEVKKATFLLAECLFENKDNCALNKNIISETWRGKAVGYDIKYKDKFQKIHPCYNEEIYFYIRKYLSVDETKTTFFRT